jgi:hypothetical protein
VEGRGQVQVFGHLSAAKNVISPKIGPDPDFSGGLLARQIVTVRKARKSE